jgi:hypothetical protein
MLHVVSFVSELRPRKVQFFMSPPRAGFFWLMANTRVPEDIRIMKIPLFVGEFMLFIVLAFAVLAAGVVVFWLPDLVHEIPGVRPKFGI